MKKFGVPKIANIVDWPIKRQKGVKLNLWVILSGTKREIMSQTPKKTGEGGTPLERRGSKQDIEFKGEILKMFTEIKKGIKQREKNLEMRLESIDKKYDMTVNELRGQMKEITKRMQNLEEEMKRIKQEVKEIRKEQERVKGEVAEIKKTQKELWDAIAGLL